MEQDKIVIEHLNLWYGSFQALKDINLRLPANEITAFIGPSGCGASPPVTTPPQTGILGVCNIQTKIKSAKEGVIETYPAMGLSLTFDHRVIDGAPAARYMSELCKSLENFMTLLAK
mgnify:CR=1 FL=1